MTSQNLSSDLIVVFPMIQFSTSFNICFQKKSPVSDVEAWRFQSSTSHTHCSIFNTEFYFPIVSAKTNGQDRIKPESFYANYDSDRQCQVQWRFYVYRDDSNFLRIQFDSLLVGERLQMVSCFLLNN